MELEIFSTLKDMKSYENEQSVDLLKKLCQLYCQHGDEKSRQIMADQMAKEGAAEVFTSMLTGFSGTGFFKSNNVWFPTYYTLKIIWNLSDASLLFAKELGKLGAIQHFLSVLGHGPYKEKLHEKNVQYLLRASLCILHNAAKVPKNRTFLRQNEGVQKIVYYTKMDQEPIKVVSIMLLGYIINESESELIMDEAGAVEIMVRLLQEALNSKDHRCGGYRASEIVEGLTLIATCERNKYKIFESGTIPLCETMMTNEDPTERQFATRLVWQLAFDEMLREKLKANETLMLLVDELMNDSDTAVKQSAQGARWVLQQQAAEIPPQPALAGPAGHVMISYQWNNQKTMLKINSALKKAGIKVWIDVEQIAGSTLQAMAEAVEKAAIVLIGVSPKYKGSPNCRTEAEYTFQMRKPIIPLMMEHNYKPDGWLGALLGSTLWIDFSKGCDFGESVGQLIKDIERNTKGQSETPTDPIQTCTDGTDFPVIAWTKEDVSAWLKGNQLDFCLGSFTEYDGSLLYQLQQLRKEAPEFFYASLRNDLGFTSITEILQFLRAFDQLYQYS